MKHMLCSQMSSVKHQMNQLQLKFVKLEDHFDRFIKDFMRPYQAQAQGSNLKITLHIMN